MRLVGSGTQLAPVVLLAVAFGPDALGAFGLLVVWQRLLGQAGATGLPVLGTRFAARGTSMTSRRAYARAVTIQALRISATLAPLIALLVLAWSFEMIDATAAFWSVGVVAGVAGQIALRTMLDVMRSVDLATRAVSIEFILMPLAFCAIVTLAAASGSSESVRLVVSAWSGLTVLTALAISAWILTWRSDESLAPSRPIPWSRERIAATTYSVVNVAPVPIVLLAVSSVGSLADAGSLSVATRIAGLVAVANTALSAQYSPLFARGWLDASSEQFLDLAVRSTRKLRKIFVLLAPCLLACAVAFALISSDYGAVPVVTAVLLCGQVVFAWVGLADELLLMSAGVASATRAALAQLIVVASFSWPASALGGAVAAAAVLAASVATRALLSSWWGRILVDARWRHE
jgi:hypothetical protein